MILGKPARRFRGLSKFKKNVAALSFARKRESSELDKTLWVPASAGTTARSACVETALAEMAQVAAVSLTGSLPGELSPDSSNSSAAGDLTTFAWSSH
jgi:hypothetical protein